MDRVTEIATQTWWGGGLGAGWSGVLFAPVEHRFENDAQGAAGVGELVDDPRRDLGVDGAGHQAASFERAETLGDRLRAGIAECRTDLTEPAWTSEQFAHDQRGPFAFEDLQRAFDATLDLRYVRIEDFLTASGQVSGNSFHTDTMYQGGALIPASRYHYRMNQTPSPAHPTPTTSTRIVVHGATGTQGRPLVDRLVADGHTVVAVSRTGHPVGGATEHAGADLADAASLEAAYRDADAVVVQLPLVFSELAVQQVDAVIDALGRAAVPRVVFNAGGPVLPHPIGVPYADARSHLAQRLGDVVAHAGVVSPAGGYMENLSAPGLAGRIGRGELAYPLPAQVPMPWLALADLANVVADALVAPTPLGFKVLAGPQALTGDEAAAVISAAVGRPVAWVTIAPEEFEVMLTPQIGADAAAGIAGFYRSAAEGAPPPPDPATVITTSTTLAEWASTVAWR